METISVTIPMEEKALLKMANWFRSLAGIEAEQTISGDQTVVELSPQAEATATGQRIDNMIAAAGAPEVETAIATDAPLLDSEGRPWDARIDSGAKSRTKDGRWKLMRGVDAALVDQVKAELLQGEEPVVATVPPAIETPAVITPPATAPVVAPVIETPAVVPVVAAPAVAPVAITTYAQLVPRLTAQADAKVLQPNDVLDTLAATGASAAGAVNLTELAKPEYAVYIPLVAAELERIWATRV